MVSVWRRTAEWGTMRDGGSKAADGMCQEIFEASNADIRNIDSGWKR